MSDDWMEDRGLFIRRAIREEIFSRGLGAKFTVKEIKDALTAKGIEVDSRKVSALTRQGENVWFRKISRDVHKGYVYTITKIPRWVDTGDDV